MVAGFVSQHALTDDLNRRGIPAARGGDWHRNSIARVLRRLGLAGNGGRVVGLNLLGWIAIFAPLGLLMLTSYRAAQMSVGAVQAVYWAVTALMGVSLSLPLFTYTGCRYRKLHARWHEG